MPATPHSPETRRRALEVYAATRSQTAASEATGVPKSTIHQWVGQATTPPEGSALPAREPIADAWDAAQRAAIARNTSLHAVEPETPEQAAALLSAGARWAHAAHEGYMDSTVGRRGTTVIGTQINGSDVLLALAEARRMELEPLSIDEVTDDAADG